MSSAELKRPLQAKKQKMKGRKKRKLVEEDGPTAVAPNEAAADQSHERLKLDELNWTPINIPENMDDYEGFYGLEELDGVEVVKDKGGAQISFRMARGPSNKVGSKIKDTGSKNVTRSAKSVHGNKKTSATYEEEWTGFDDESDEATPRNEKGSKPDKQQPKPEANMSDRSAKKAADKTEKRSKDDEIFDGTGFSILEDQDDSTETDVSAWGSLDLSTEVLSSLSKMGFSTPTEIQASAIPHIKEGNDLIGKAPTGSGKTLAFGIPIIEDWITGRHNTQGKSIQSELNHPTALIILPTRELAHQICNHIQNLIRGAALDDNLKTIAITGGLSIYKQRRLLSQANIIVGTPGRLWEVITEGQGVLESLKNIKFLVVDEADRLLSEGHFRELEEIINALEKETTDETQPGVSLETSNTSDYPKNKRQTLVFSATFSKSLHQKLSGRRGFHSSKLIHDKSDTMEYLLRKLNFHSTDPAFIDVNPVEQMATNLREGVVECASGTDKDLYLYTLLLYHHPGARALIFVNSISAVKRLVPLLNNLDLLAFALHSHMPQKARLRSVERFSSLLPATVDRPNPNKGDTGSSTGPRNQQEETKILVATDVAARGLDIPNITLVLHYHLPRTADGYVHRSGRTARASNTGSSILLCAPEEVAGVRRLVAQVHADAASASSQDTRSTKKGETARYKNRSGKFYMQTLYPDTRLVSGLRPRVALAKKTADSVIVKDKKRKEEDFFRAAAEELGVSSASEDFPEEGSIQQQKPGKDGAKGYLNEKKGKGAKKRMENLSVTQEQMRAMQAELKALLKKKINLGVSEKYLVSKGGDEVARLLRERETASAEGVGKLGGGPRFDAFGVLGNVAPLGWEV